MALTDYVLRKKETEDLTTLKTALTHRYNALNTSLKSVNEY